jgi:hypothetical protein
METKPTGSAVESSPTRRRRRTTDEPTASARFFLPKPGSGSGDPELGQEFTTECEVLIAALKQNQPFYVVTTWNAVPEQNGGAPVIRKQPVTGARKE